MSKKNTGISLWSAMVSEYLGSVLLDRNGFDLVEKRCALLQSKALRCGDLKREVVTSSLRVTTELRSSEWQQRDCLAQLAI